MAASAPIPIPVTGGAAAEVTELLSVATSAPIRREEVASSSLPKNSEVEAPCKALPDPRTAGESKSDVMGTEMSVSGVQIGPTDFTVLKAIGRGGFGRVFLVRYKHTGVYYAMKVISKELLRRKNQVDIMKAERTILTKVTHPFVVGLQVSFQTDSKLFLVMDYLQGGELFFHLQKQGLLLPNAVRFYIGEIALALEFLHSVDILHRDLKPENLLLAKDGHVSLTDFGLAKELPTLATEDEDDVRTRTICGTTEYMAPEMIKGKGYGKAVDWWSLGALAFEMMTGAPPFRGRSIKEINQKIINGKLKLPSWLDSRAHSLLRGLLQKNALKRLGASKSTMFEVGGTRALKNHAFFEGLDWDALLAKQLDPPLPLSVTGEDDTSYFDEEFTKMDVRRSITKMTEEELNRKHSDNFDRFSFIHRDFTPPPEKYKTRMASLDDIESFGAEDEGVAENTSAADSIQNPDGTRDADSRGTGAGRAETSEMKPCDLVPGKSCETGELGHDEGTPSKGATLQQDGNNDDGPQGSTSMGSMSFPGSSTLEADGTETVASSSAAPAAGESSRKSRKRRQRKNKKNPNQVDEVETQRFIPGFTPSPPPSASPHVSGKTTKGGDDRNSAEPSKILSRATSASPSAASKGKNGGQASSVGRAAGQRSPQPTEGRRNRRNRRKGGNGKDRPLEESADSSAISSGPSSPNPSDTKGTSASGVSQLTTEKNSFSQTGGRSESSPAPHPVAPKPRRGWAAVIDRVPSPQSALTKTPPVQKPPNNAQFNNNEPWDSWNGSAGWSNTTYAASRGDRVVQPRAEPWPELGSRNGHKGYYS